MKVFSGGSGRKVTPRRDNGINAGIIIALNINVANIAVAGLCSCITLRIANFGLLVINIAGSIAKYLATSLAMLNVVIAPRVMSNCLPSFTTFNIFEGQNLDRPY